MLSENLQKIQVQIPQSCMLLPVSKTKPLALLQEAYNLGIRMFGENKVQELVDKSDALPKDIQWHFIGHLQTNKVKFIAPFVHLIHAIDSLKLLKEINKRAIQNNRIINCLLQIHIAEESSKFGLSPEGLFDLINNEAFKNLQNIKVVGLMGMATNTSDLQKVRTEFKNLKTLFEQLKKDHQSEKNMEFSEISMGMSNDYPIAIEEGSTIVRIGSLIFGNRN